MSSPGNNRPYIGVAVMVWQGDMLLLGKRKEKHAGQSWQFPGGHLEWGESVSECAVREAREEAGIEISDVQHAGFTGNILMLGGRQYITLFVSAQYSSGDAHVMEPDKCSCWRWFNYDELPSPLFSPITDFLQQVSSLKGFR